MKKNNKLTLIILGIVVVLIGIIIISIGVKSGIDSVLLEGAPKESVEKTKFDEMTEFVDGNFRLSEAMGHTIRQRSMKYTLRSMQCPIILLSQRKNGEKKQ